MVYNDCMNETHSIQGQKRPSLGVFLAATVVVFFLTFSSASSVGFVPEYLDSSDSPAVAASDDGTVALSSLPELGSLTNVPKASEEYPAADGVVPARISIGAISLDLAVQNPETKDIVELDEILKSGPARYVSSAKLGEKGTMIIFAHSSHLPIVHNKMFRAFNGIPDLETGDTITLTGEDGMQYLYSVKSVDKVNAEDTVINMSPELGTRLILVTCNTLASKSARFVLEATLVGTIGN